MQNGRKKRPSLLSGALRKPDPRPKNTTPEDEVKTQHNCSCPPPPLDLCKNQDRTRFRTIGLCGLVTTLWICVKVQIHWIADPSLKCQRNTLPGNLTLPNQLTSRGSHLVKQVLDKTERRFPEEVANSRTSFRRKRTWVSSNRQVWQPNFGSVPYT